MDELLALADGELPNWHRKSLTEFLEGEAAGLARVPVYGHVHVRGVAVIRARAT
ncbi:MAG TPA: hypothetical protein VMN36_15465 [Verrucomicrobiales bacterium]|nr:hypothetical protein [Verrucomicrobiales bacterium]